MDRSGTRSKIAAIDDIIMWTTTYINTSEDMFFQHYRAIFSMPFSHIIVCGLTGELARECPHVTDLFAAPNQALVELLRGVDRFAESVLICVHLPHAAELFRLAPRLISRATIIIISQVYNDSTHDLPPIENFIYEFNYKLSCCHRHDLIEFAQCIRFITRCRGKARRSKVEQWQSIVQIRAGIFRGKFGTVKL